jgi:hypothetical protein
VSQGYITYFNTDPVTGQKKSDSFPLRAVAGLRGLITQKLTMNVALGYANGLYEAGPTTSGIAGSLSISVDGTYRPTVTSAVTLGYRHDFQNSILGNFYYVDAFYASFQQQIAGRVSAMVSGRYERRNFQIDGGTAGTITRLDNFVQAGAAIDYHIRSWMYAGVGYGLVLNDSEAAAGGTSAGAVNYVKHQVFARLGVTY